MPGMKILNWSAIEALVRAMVILAAAAFFGALVLPLAADGTLPADWAHWRPVLATAFGAMVAAELYWVRTHVAAVAAAAGLSPPTLAPTAAAALKSLSMLAVIGLFGCGLFGAGAATAVLPAIASEQCIQDDAQKGDSIAQIVADCGGDVAQVVSSLLANTAPATAKQTKAYTEAQKVKAAVGGAS